jgi:hypothetical protein
MFVSLKKIFFSFVKSDSNIIKVIERSIIMDFGMNVLKYEFYQLAS